MDLATLNIVVGSTQVAQATVRLNQLTAASGRAEQSTIRLGSASQGLANKMQLLMGVVGAVTAAYGALKTVLYAIQQTADFETLVVGMTTLLRSTEKAKAMLNDLVKFALETPFEMKGLAQQTKLLLALQFQAEEVLPILRIVGDAAAGLGLGTEGMNRINIALGQIRMRGKIAAQEMNQLINAGINGWGYLADAIGTDIKTVQRLAFKGMIDGREGVKVILAGMQKDFKDGMKNMSVTVNGIWQRLLEEADVVARGIGDALIEGLNIKGGMQEAIEWIKFLGAMVTDFIRMMLGLEAKLLSTSKMLAPIVAAIKQFYSDLKVGWFTVLSWLSKGWEYIKFGFNVAWTTVKEGFLTALEFIRKAFVGFLKIVQEALGGMANGKGSTVLMKALGLDPEVVKGLHSMTNELVAALDVPLTTKTFGEYIATLSGFHDNLNKNLRNIDVIRERRIKMYRNSGFFNDILSTLGQIPGFGAMTEFKDMVLKEMDENAQATPGLNQTDPTKGAGGLVKPNNVDLARGLATLKEMNDEQDLLLKTAGMTADQREREVQLAKMRQVIDDTNLDKDAEALRLAQQYIDIYEQQYTKLKQMEELRALADDLGQAFAGAFEEFVLGAKDAQEALSGLFKMVQQILVRQLVTKPLEGFLSSAITNIGGAFLGIGAKPTYPNLPDRFGDTGQFISQEPSVPMVGSYNGNLFAGGQLVPFANGGVVDSPAFFPMRGNRIGMVGERGPEAIMPLSRGPDGKLGVRGGGSSSKTTIVNFKVYATDADSFRRSKRQIASDMRRVTA